MRRRALACVALAAVTAALLSAPQSDAGAADSAARPLQHPTAVTLPTGDRVRLDSAGGRQRIDVVPAERAGVTGSFEKLSRNGHAYVLPGEVRPLLGVLDPSLFDIDALAAEGGSRIPVSLTLAAGAQPDVPGFTQTARAGDTADGYLTPSAALRTALVRAARASASTGHAPTSLFGGVTRITARSATAAGTHPDFPQVTLIIDVLAADGTPAPGGILGLINTDSANKFSNFVVYNKGEARVSLPLGNYSAITDVASFTGGTFADRILPVADFAVTTNDQRLTIDAADATSVPSVSTPRPAQVATESLEFDRNSRDGGSLGSSFLYEGPSDVQVAPTGPARVGTLHWLTSWSLVHSAATSPFTYDLSFDHDGSVPADEAESVTSPQLATIDSRYYNDKSRESQFVRSAIYPFQFGVFSLFLPLHTPIARTEYVYGGASAVWTASLLADPTDSNPFGGDVEDDFRVYPQGARFQADWLRGMLRPAPPVQTSGDTYYSCPMCRSAGKMTVLLAPFVDTTPGHFGEVSDPRDGPATHFRLSRGSTVLASGADLIGAEVSVPADQRTYDLHLSVDRSADKTLTATKLVTDLRFRSAASSGAPAPSGWQCDLATAHGACTLPPVLTTDVPLPTTLDDRLPVGATTFPLTVARFGARAGATINTARVQLKIGSGAYRDADVQQVGNGRFRVTLHNPASAAGQPVTLRVSASDDSGDSITQTTTAAYLVASS